MAAAAPAEWRQIALDVTAAGDIIQTQLLVRPVGGDERDDRLTIGDDVDDLIEGLRREHFRDGQRTWHKARSVLEPG
ncbi:hypothetical protein [Jiangella muralis]|uniref:hypothetical protein n=1 Tax=Jiangella muralis TaxID=702383 RepID=UPI0012FB280E|nr:hypothetical protein [Jiangella muralis]